MPRSTRFLALVLSLVVGSGCIVARPPTARPLLREVRTSHPVKVQMLDGSVVVFHAGTLLTDRAIEGYGHQFDLALESIGERTSVPVDSVAGALVLRHDEIEPFTSWVMTLATGVGLVYGALHVFFLLLHGGTFT